jgi:hypothetical protein
LRRCALLIVALASTHAANAAHPFISEDPGTLGTGRFELELGLAYRRGDPSIPGRELAFNPQLSIGVADNVDVIAQAAFLKQWVTQGPTVAGMGDTLLDVKWRFYESDRLAFATRAGLDLPTGSSDVDSPLGAGQLGFHAIGIAGVTFGEYAVYGNVAYARTRAPDTRSNLLAVSAALTRPDDRPFRGFIEFAASSNEEPGNPQWPAVARVGGIYTVNPWLDVDAGFQARLNKSATRAVYLFGATVRW